MQFRLQVSVAIAFTVLTIIVLGIAVTVFYVNNRNLAYDTARTAMADARSRTDQALINVVAPVGRTVLTTAQLLEQFPDNASSFKGLSIVGTEIEGLDQIYSAFFGLQAGGGFFQVVQLPETMETFGPSGASVPYGTKQVMRIIQSVGKSRFEVYSYLGQNGETLYEEIGSAEFDPRKRPWYEVARETDRLAASPIYVFESTGRPGLTFSKRVLGADGALLGVVGADMSLNALTDQLNDIRIGKEGEIFLLDGEGGLITQTDYSGGGAQNPVTRAAIEKWKETGEDIFEMRVPGLEARYLVSIEALSPVYGISPRFGVVVPAREFVGAIIDATQRVLAISLVIVLIAVLATVLMARILSRNLRLVAAEARRISDFDLSGDFDLSSNIVEVNELESAVSNMKNSLRSFGAYVPKDLVKSIVSSGTPVTIGGTARELTILFSDIESFTRKSEALPPEAVMRDLSRYFDEMQAAISGKRGAIDKYIGDAVMALWNAPELDDDHVAHACQAVLACRAAERTLNETFGNADLFPTRTRFGLHTDTVVVGNVGSERRLQYTAIGDAVNLASRIEGLNKVYGTDILVTETIVERVGDRFTFRPVDMVAPAGKTQPIGLFELVGDAGHGVFSLDQAAVAELDDWKAAHALYQARDWPAALDALRALRQASTRPDLVDLYIERCERFIETPPPADWDGVQSYEKK